MRGGPDSQLIRTNSASAFRGAASSAAEKRGAKAERSTFDEKFTEEWKAETGLQYSGMDEPEDSEPSVSDEDVVYIVEPKGDGELYMYIKGKPLQVRIDGSTEERVADAEQDFPYLIDVVTYAWYI